jgi:hypothetical protein
MKLKLFKFKKEKSFKKESSWFNLILYWKLAVCFVLLATVVSLVFGYYLFTQINQEIIIPIVAQSGQIETVKKERIDKVLQIFSAREVKSTGILNSPAPIADPSL